MSEDEIVSELDKDPFRPFRLHMVSGKVFDILAPNVAHLLSNSPLILRNPVLGTRRAGGYDVIGYHNIERIEQLNIGAATRQRSASPRSAVQLASSER
jgi:hypothetical protein